MAIPPLSLRLFGPFRVTVRGVPLPPVRTRSVEWLLALLALRHGRAVSRAWLAGTLWPESDASQALANLRNDLMRLRQALGPESHRLLSPTRDALTLALDGTEVDVVQFDGAIRAGDAEALREAVALYTGPLLEGCVAEWVLPERETRAEQCLAALETLADRAATRGELREAISDLRRAEALDPLRDSVAQRLMAHLAAVGDPAAAIQVYRDFRLRLHEELAAQPDAATTQLFHEVRDAARRRAGEGGREGGREGAREQESEGARDPTAVSLDPSLSRSLAPSLPPSLPPAVPHVLTPLIGREQEVAELRAQLQQSRLVTLIGGGGVGKTRLALEVAAQAGLPGGVLWVELAPLAEGELVLPSIAAALGLREESVRETETLEARLVARLSEGAALLALDNCEHVLDAAAAAVQTLLPRCPGLRVLATSRQRLRLAGEVAWRVPSLMESPAVRLFVERAATARPGFQLTGPDQAVVVGEICRRLDGIPLAIELAAARVRVLTVAQIAARLENRFHLLTTGVRGTLPRHQTLRALIDWSYDLLPEEEAALLRQLAVFAGGWTLEAAEAICDFGFWILDIGLGADASAAPGAATPSAIQNPKSKIQNPEVLDLLDALEDRSLILVEERSGELRYRMLETVREYALEKLRERGEEEAARAAHLASFLRLAETMGPELRGSDPEAALTQLEAELDNLRAALRFSAEHAAFRLPASTLDTQHSTLTAGEAGLRLGAALWPFWETRGYLSEGRHSLHAALQRPCLPGSAERAQALLGAARLALQQFDLDEAEHFAQESLEWFRTRGDDRGRAAALLCLGEVAGERGDRPTAGSRFAEGLEASRQSGWTRGSALMLVWLGMMAMAPGETARARSLLEEGRALAEAVGDAPTLAVAFRYLADVAVWEGDDTRARPLLERSLAISRRLGDKRATADVLSALARLAERQGDRTEATSYLEEAVAIYRELGNRMTLACALLDLASVHYREGAYVAARAIYEESLGMLRELKDAYWIAAACNNLGMACYELGDPVRAQALHREALALYHIGGSAEGVVWALERLGVVTARHGAPQQAARLLGAASTARGEYAQGEDWKEAMDWEVSDLRQAAAAVREQLGPEAWAAAWAAGRAMPREQAIAFALDDAAT